MVKRSLPKAIPFPGVETKTLVKRSLPKETPFAELEPEISD